LNSQTTANVTEQAKNLAGQAHAQAHAIAPSVIPAPATGATTSTGVTSGLGGDVKAGVDTSSDLEPENAADKAKLEKLFGSRPAPEELQEKGILKG